jgi:hypothetical protein
VFPGHWLKPEAMVAGRLGEVLTAVQEGIASGEHREFVNRLTTTAGARAKGDRT